MRNASIIAAVFAPRRLTLASLAVVLAACGGASETEPTPGPGGGGSSTPDAGSKPPPGNPTPNGGDASTPTPTPDSGTPTPTDSGTPTPQALRFVAVGDTGKGGPDEQAVASAIANKCQVSGCDFVLLLGDNIYDTGVSSPDDPQFKTKFEDPYSAVPGPIYASLGNHDYGGGGIGNEFGKAQHQVDYTAKSTKWKMPSHYYRFTAGNAEFFAMDTNSQMYGRDAQQKTDMKAWITQSTATWKFVFGHHPYKSNGPHGNAGNYEGLPFVPVFNGAGVKSFAEDVYCGRADMYFAGHDHSRQWHTDTCNGTALIVSGAGAAGTELKGTNPTHFQSNELGFLYVVIEGKKLTADFVHMSGTVNFTRTIQK